MFTVGNCDIDFLDEHKLTKAEIQGCLDDYKKHELPKYWWRGRIVEKGEVVLHTSQGDITLLFRVSNHKAEQLILT